MTIDYPGRFARLDALKAADYGKDAYADDATFARAESLLRQLQDADVAPPGVFLDEGSVLLEWFRSVDAGGTKVVSVEVRPTTYEAFWLLTPSGDSGFDEAIENEADAVTSIRDALEGTGEYQP